MKLRFFLTIGVLFILAGGLVGSQFVRHGNNINATPAVGSAVAQAAQNPTPTTATISGEPNHIEIPSLGISLEVEKGYYIPARQTWTLSNTKADYAAITPMPNNEGGNTFIYGHNKPGVFQKLLKIQPGAEAIITTANGHTFTYKLAGSRDTKPTDTSLFTYQGKPILTLQTCSGAWYQNRRLFTFDLVKAV